MASFWSFLAMFMLFIAYFTSLASTAEVHVQFSTISAAPAFLPDSPLSSPPNLSPDIMPIFPTTKAGAPSPTESSLPTIPSSPSPPNPDVTEVAPVPTLANSPTGSMPESSSNSLMSSGLLKSTAFLGCWPVFFLMQLSGM